MKSIPWSNNCIFYARLNEYLNLPGSNAFFIIYAPGNGYSVIVDDSTFTNLINDQPEAKALKAQLLSPPLLPCKANEQNRKHMELLPTMACNFRCSYCYAAQAHSRQKLVRRQYKTLIENFITPQDAHDTTYEISFVGGGEPVLEWPDICYCLEAATAKAKAFDRHVRFSIISNGSLLGKDKLEQLKKYNVAVRISFEILRDVQEQQRGSYQQVADNIASMCSYGIKVGIRSIITPGNVLRQAEMVKVVAEYFPNVKVLDFEPVCTDRDSAQTMDDFYHQYTLSFFEALNVAEAHSIRLDSIAMRMARGRSTHFCPGDYCISPTGIVTACHRSVTQADSGYETFVYGKLYPDGTVYTDTAKLQAIQNMKMAKNYEACQSCFAKMNCSGGCLYQRLLLNETQFQSHCHFIRNFLVQYLLKIQNKACEESCNMTLPQLLAKATDNQ